LLGDWAGFGALNGGARRMLDAFHAIRRHFRAKQRVIGWHRWRAWLFGHEN
jgi:hypothetical protein